MAHFHATLDMPTRHPASSVGQVLREDSRGDLKRYACLDVGARKGCWSPNEVITQTAAVACESPRFGRTQRSGTPTQRSGTRTLRSGTRTQRSGTRTRKSASEYEYEYHFIEYEYENACGIPTQRSGTRTRKSASEYEYEYHFIEYEYENAYGIPTQRSGTPTRKMRASTSTSTILLSTRTTLCWGHSQLSSVGK